MTLSGRFFLPGPVEVDPEVMTAMQRPMIGHRGAEAHALVGRLQPGLRTLFGTTRPVMLATGSATAMMEAGVRSGVRERALCIVSGTFGERFANIVERCGKEAIRIHVHPGDVVEPDLLAPLLDGPPIDAITLVHCETSTGALAPVGALLNGLRDRSELISIVDAVTSVGGCEVPADRWGADFVLTGSQKALGLPPGLAFAVASDRYLLRAREIEERGFYLDVLDLHRAAVESRFPQTPALPVVYALEAQLERIEREGLPRRWERHQAMQRLVESWVAERPHLGILARSGHRSTTITAITLPEGISAREVAGRVASDGWQVAIGLDQQEDRLIRIGHMGDLQPDHLPPLLAAIDRALP